MNAANLRHAVEVWGNVEVPSELNEVDIVPQLLRVLNHVEIIPQTGSLQRQPGIETIMSKVTHKATVRYFSGKDLKDDQWFMYRGQRFDIRFILNPYFRNEKLEIFLEAVNG